MTISILISMLLSLLPLLVVIREEQKEIPVREDEKDYQANYAWLDEKDN